MSFIFWFPLGIGSGIALVIWSYAADFRGFRTMVEKDIADADEEGNVWAAFHSGPKKEVMRDPYKFEELMQRIQLGGVALCVLVGLLILIGPW